MRVEVIDASGTAVDVHEVVLDAPQTIAAVLAKAGIGIPDGGAVGVHGRVRATDTLVRDGDRVEIYAALQADPKQARRVRARRQRLR